MINDNDLLFMKRALELASLGLLTTRPNPMVGAVIVYNNSIIGEGYHLKAGGNHAEVNAIQNCPQELLAESTIYVTLEPCSHYGKTPPCADLIVEKGFKRVVIGAIDTSDKVSGRGIEILRKGGCEVVTGVLEKECRDLNRRFFTYNELKRPYIVLKWAESKDGYIDIIRDSGKQNGPTWITGIDERILVHKWRAEEHSILIGGNTMKIDNPELNVRLWEGNDPLRVVLTDSEVLPPGLKLLEDKSPLLLFSTSPLKTRKNKVNIVVQDKSTAIVEVINELTNREIQSLMVEGGANVLSQFINLNLWDEARIFKGNSDFGSGIAAPVIDTNIDRKEIYENSTLIYMYR